MGFYAPAQIVRDAREHEVEVRPACINRSEWDSAVEAIIPPQHSLGRNLLPLRLGLRVIRGLAAEHASKILMARAAGPFASIEDVWHRSGVPVAALERLAEADAFRGLDLDRRQALWQVRGLGEKPLPCSPPRTCAKPGASRPCNSCR
jgi:error-prone DNA polymerase